MVDLIEIQNHELCQRAARAENESAVLRAEISDLRRKLDCLRSAQVRAMNPDMEWLPIDAAHPSGVAACITGNRIGLFGIQGAMNDELRATMLRPDEILEDDLVQDLLNGIKHLIQKRVDYDKKNRAMVMTLRLVVGMIK